MEDRNFSGGRDRITYRAAVKNSRKPLTVFVELLYQALAYPFVLGLKQDETALVQGS